jgi:hypothetical protein
MNTNQDVDDAEMQETVNAIKHLLREYESGKHQFALVCYDVIDESIVG